MSIKRPVTFRRLFNYFLGGLLITLPIVGTAYVIYASFVTIDNLIDTKTLFGNTVPGLGILLILVFITIVGFVGEGILTKPILDFFEHLIERTPGIKVIYSMIKDFMEAFVGDKRKFTEGVAVELTNGLFRLGFVTSHDLKAIEMDGFVAVYFPHSYAFSGNLFLVPKERIKTLKGNSSELMKFIVSGGVTDVEAIRKFNKNEETPDSLAGS
ncbi:MAG: DUF502 domain-containing protein [Bacteroidetes bacterium]|nr:DUF502 domain-containing protein [Bacteroidota bacterium]